MTKWGTVLDGLTFTGRILGTQDTPPKSDVVFHITPTMVGSVVRGVGGRRSGAQIDSNQVVTLARTKPQVGKLSVL